MATQALLLYLVGTAFANPLWTRQSSQQINIDWSLSASEFKGFENPTTLKQYFQNKGYSNLNLNFRQLSDGVVSINNYFSQKASQTGSASAASDSFAAQADSPIQSNTNSTSLKGGPSYTSINLSANATFVEAISFSNGDAATAGGAIQRTQTSSSTASSGASNSTAKVTGNSQMAQIITNSIVNGASDSRQVDGGPKDALTGGSCAARATGASSRASIVTILNIPVNGTGSATVASIAKSFCEAGVSAKNSGKPGGTGTSSSGMQAALTSGGIKASVVCNGQTSNATPSISFSVQIRGSYSQSSGFKGTFTGARTASASISCS